MAGTQAPKGFGLVFVFVGIPLILWSAWGTNEELQALKTPEARQAQCREKIVSLAPELSVQDSEGMCRCMVLEAENRSMPAGETYDEAALRPIVELCYQAHVLQ